MKKLIIAAMFITTLAVGVFSQTTEFTYQGNLKNGGTPATGSYDFEFKLFDLVSGGAQQGSSVQKLNVAVANGLFTVPLDFGAGNLPGADRFLEIGVRVNGGPGGFQQLLPRQKVNSAPYSVKSLNSATATTATTATNATQLGGVAASQYVVTTDPRMTDARPPTAGSTNYIQNQNAAPQSSSNFNISGNGTAGIFNAVTQFNLNGSRILSNPGTENLFAGVGAGQANTGSFNSFFGLGAGQATTTSNGSSFFGRAAGFANTTGNENSFFGQNAGLNNTTASGNSFLGTAAGQSNTTGAANSFVGYAAGLSNQTADNNSFFGFNAGRNNTTGFNNSFFGTSAGQNTTAGGNAFFGYGSGNANTTGASNTAIGANANVGSGNLNHATAIGADSTVSATNTIALGRSNGSDLVLIPGNLIVSGIFNLPAGDSDYIQNGTALQSASQNISGNAYFGGNVGIGTTSPVFGKLQVNSSNADAIYGNTAIANGFGVTGVTTNGRGVYGVASTSGVGVYGAATTGKAGFFAGSVGITTSLGIGITDTETPVGNLQVRDQGASTTGRIQVGATVADSSLKIITFGDSGCSGGPSCVYIGEAGIDDRMILRAGQFSLVNGIVSIQSLGSGGSVALCRNSIEQLSTCSSSLRYKTNIGQFSQGMSFVNRLRPISFDWKEGGMKDVGFGAEEVEKIDPRFVTYNDKGEVEGVKYDRLSVAFVNTFKEQQGQIEEQRSLIESQQKQNDKLQKQVNELKMVVCSMKGDADICKEN